MSAGAPPRGSAPTVSVSGTVEEGHDPDKGSRSRRSFRRVRAGACARPGQGVESVGVRPLLGAAATGPHLDRGAVGGGGAGDIEGQAGRDGTGLDWTSVTISQGLRSPARWPRPGNEPGRFWHPPRPEPSAAGPSGSTAPQTAAKAPLPPDPTLPPADGSHSLCHHGRRGFPVFLNAHPPRHSGGAAEYDD